MRPFRRQAHIVGEAGGDTQVKAPPRAFAPQEIGLHLYVALAEQEEVEPTPIPFERLHPQRFARGPAGMCAFLPCAAELFEQGVGVASVRGRQGVCDILQLFLGRPVGDHAAIHQGGDRVQDCVKWKPQRLDQGRHVLRHLPRTAEIVEDAVDLGVDGQAQMADRMDGQTSVRIQRDNVQKARSVQNQRGDPPNLVGRSSPGALSMVNESKRLS